MANTKLNVYFFGEIGEYDSYNPAYVCSGEHVSEILYLIAQNEPFSLRNSDLAKLLSLEEDTVRNSTDSLKLINAIEENKDAYKINFPAFLKKDVIELEGYTRSIGEQIGHRIIQMKDMLYKKLQDLKSVKIQSNERLLYHIICDKVFDGAAFDFFTKNNIFSASKQQPGNRNYIIIAYEDNEFVDKLSNKLLCSSNNYRCPGFTFNSFGDSNGTRKDMFRFFRLVQKAVDGASPFHELNVAYNKVLDKMNRETAAQFGKLLCRILDKTVKSCELSPNEQNLAHLLEELEYISIDNSDNIVKVEVPVFFEYEISTVIKEISDLILTDIYPTVKEALESFETNAGSLTSVKHQVDIKEIANEVWHQIFGAANEYLVSQGFVAAPPDIEAQGRYLRSLTVSDF